MKKKVTTATNMLFPGAISSFSLQVSGVTFVAPLSRNGGVGADCRTSEGPFSLLFIAWVGWRGGGVEGGVNG